MGEPGKRTAPLSALSGASEVVPTAHQTKEGVGLFLQTMVDDSPMAVVNPLFQLLVSERSVLVNGEAVRCLWDAMCIRSVITEECARRLGLQVEEHASGVRFDFAARGAAVCERRKTSLIRVTVKDDEQEDLRLAFNLDVLVSNQIDAFELILGKDAHSLLSRQCKLHIDFGENVLYLYANGQQLKHTARDGSREAEGIFTVSTVDLPFTTPLQATPTTAEPAEGAPGSAAVNMEVDNAEEVELRAREERVRRDFEDVFSPLQEGETRPVLPGIVTIEFTKEGPPPMTTPRRVRFAPREIEHLDKRLKVLEETGVIARTATAAHISPFFLVTKAGSTPENPKWREIIDMRELNERVVPMAMHTPLIMSLLEDAAHSRIFSVMDISEAFWTVPIAEEFKDYFAFIDHRQRVWRFEVCPFGFKNSPAIFGNALEKAMHNAPPSASRYCDDLLCHTDEVEQHDRDIRRLLEIIRAFRLRLNSKSELFRRRVKYVGHWLAHNQIAPILEQDTLRNWPLPTTQTAMRSLLGLANFYKDFVPRLGLICAPLYELTGKGRAYELEDRHVAAFHALVEALLNASSLYPPSRSPGTRTRLYVDASQVGSGAHLQQLIDGKWRPVGFATKLFNKRQSQYSAVVREAIGIVQGIRRFYHIFKYQTVEVYSDQKPLIDALNGDPDDPRWKRVLAELLQLDFKLLYVQGQHNLADLFSRPSAVDMAEHVLEEWKPEAVPMYGVQATTAPIVDDSWPAALKEDERTAAIMASVSNGDCNAEYLGKKYCVQDGLLHFLDPLGRKRLVVPESKVVQVLAHFHDSAVAGHPSAERMLDTMAELVYMRKMGKRVRAYVQSCDGCGRSKPKKNSTAPAHSIEIPARPFQHISIDLFTSLPAVKAHDNEDKVIVYDAIMTVTCLLTRSVSFLATTINLTGAGAARLILETWAVGRNVGYPESILSDRDVRFTSEEFRAAMSSLNIRLRMSTSRSAETNGATEVFHRSLKSYLIAFCAYEPKTWVAHLPYVEASLNNAKNSSTGFAAAELVLGYRPRFTGNFTLSPEEVSERHQGSAVVEDMMRRHATALQCARDELNDTRDNFVFEHTPHHGPLILKPGDMVYVDTSALVPTELRGVGHKLKSRFAGPYMCIKKVSNGSYKIDIPHTSRAHDVISHKFLKKAYRNEFVGRPVQPTIPRSALEPGTFEVEDIVGHELRKRQYYFKVKWMTFADTDCTFEPLASFTDSKNNIITEPLRQYIKTHNLPIAL